MIKDKEHLTDEIMGQSRHQFVYGYNGIERAEFLKEIAAAYPITLDGPNPVGIYICDKGLPELLQKGEMFDEFNMNILHRSYVEYLITHSVIDTAIQQIDTKILANLSKEFLEKINKFFISRDKRKATSLVELLEMLEESKEVCYDEYIKYVNSGNSTNLYDKFPVRIIMIERFIEFFKKMINTTSYLGIIFDQQVLLSEETQKAINNYVGSRINSNISMKIACERGAWKTDYDQNGALVQASHDYDYVELDSCQEDPKIRMPKKNIL